MTPCHVALAYCAADSGMVAQTCGVKPVTALLFPSSAGVVVRPTWVTPFTALHQPRGAAEPLGPRRSGITSASRGGIGLAGCEFGCEHRYSSVTRATALDLRRRVLA